MERMRFAALQVALRAALLGAPAITVGLACAASTREPPPVPEAVVVVAPPPIAPADGPRGASNARGQAGLDAADAGAPDPDPDDGDEGADPPVGLSGLMLLLDGGVASFQLQGSIHIAGTFSDDGGVQLSFSGGPFDDGGVSVSIQSGAIPAPPSAAPAPEDAGSRGAAPRSASPPTRRRRPDSAAAPP